PGRPGLSTGRGHGRRLAAHGGLLAGSGGGAQRPAAERGLLRVTGPPWSGWQTSLKRERREPSWPPFARASGLCPLVRAGSVSDGWGAVAYASGSDKKGFTSSAGSN